VPTLASFWCDVASNLVAGLLAGAVFVALAYFYLDKRVHLRERLEDDRRDREAQEARTEAILRAIHLELEGNASALAVARSIEDDHLSFPLFDATALQLAVDPGTIAALKQRDTVALLLRVLARTQSAVELHRMMFSFQHGEAASTVAGIHGIQDETTRAHMAAAYTADKANMHASLRERVDELAPHLFEAIDALEAHLGIVSDTPAAQRDYMPEHIGRAGTRE
jgi:hypothetical protein